MNRITLAIGLAVVAALLLIGAGMLVQRGLFPCPEPDYHRIDSLSAQALQWEGVATTLRAERDMERALREAIQRTRPSVSTLNTRNLHAILSAGFNAAIDTNSVVPN